MSLSRFHRLVILIVCLLASQGACAIDISFSASNGGGTVGIVDSYDVDDSVGVSSRSSASFGDGVSMTDVNSLSGSCDAKVDQVFYGSGFGADYVAEYALRTFDASSIEAGGSASLNPDSCQVSKSASTTDGILTFARLRGRQNGDFAAVGSLLLFGDLTATQNLVTGQSVTASQNALADGLLAWSYGWAVDGDSSLAWTSSLMINGSMSAGQTAESGNSARSSQTSEIEASLGRTGSGALDAEGNIAWMHADMVDRKGDGILVTEQSAEADGSAAGNQKTTIEGDFAWAICEAYNPGKNYDAYVDNWVTGNAYLEFEGEAKVNSGEAMAHQRSYAEGYNIEPYVYSTNYKIEPSVTGSWNTESWAWTKVSSEGVDQNLEEVF